MTVITKTNATDERTQISNALTSVEGSVATNTADIGTNTSAISALDARVTALESGVDGTPPTALVGRSVANADLHTGVGVVASTLEATASSSTFDSWTTLLTVTDSGVIEYLGVHQESNAGNLNWQARLTIDGTVVWTSDADAWQATGDNNYGFILVGHGGTAFAGTGGHIPFASSILLEFKKTENAAGTVTAGAFYRYKTT